MDDPALYFIGNQTVLRDESGFSMGRMRSFTLEVLGVPFAGTLAYSAARNTVRLHQEIPPKRSRRIRGLDNPEQSVNDADSAARIVLNAYGIETPGHMAQHYSFKSESI